MGCGWCQVLRCFLSTLWPNLKRPGALIPKDARDNSFQLRIIFYFFSVRLVWLAHLGKNTKSTSYTKNSNPFQTISVPSTKAYNSWNCCNNPNRSEERRVGKECRSRWS